jgi:hypothetical protein
MDTKPDRGRLGFVTANQRAAGLADSPRSAAELPARATGAWGLADEQAVGGGERRQHGAVLDRQRGRDPGRKYCDRRKPRCQ